MRNHAAKGIFAILVVAAWHVGAARIESFSPTGYTKDLTLDGTGTARLVIRDLPEFRDFVSLQVEMDYRDGQIKTASNGFDIWPATIRLEITWKTTSGAMKPSRAARRDSRGSAHSPRSRARTTSI